MKENQAASEDPEMHPAPEEENEAGDDSEGEGEAETPPSDPQFMDSKEWSPEVRAWRHYFMRPAAVQFTEPLFLHQHDGQQPQAVPAVDEHMKPVLRDGITQARRAYGIVPTNTESGEPVAVYSVCPAFICPDQSGQLMMVSYDSARGTCQSVVHPSRLFSVTQVAIPAMAQSSIVTPRG